MGITHYSILNSRADVEIVAIADSSLMVIRWVNKYLKGINTYKNFNELFENEILDAVVVCTPPQFHFTIIEQAARKGLHVFCEKPFTTSYSNGISLAEEYSRLNLINQVGYVNRYNDIFFRTMECIRSGVIGDVTGFKSEMYSNTVTGTGGKKGWRNSTFTGGGVVYEMASHAIDLVIYILGKPDKVSNTSLTRILSSNADDVFYTEMEYNSGISGSIHVDWCRKDFRKPLNIIEFTGTSGKITADQYCLNIYLDKDSDTLNLKKGLNTLYITDVFRPVNFYLRGNEFTRQLYEFTDMIQGIQTSCLSSFYDASSTLEIIDRVFLATHRF